jgi:protein-S-isoprenylcysteine O-methyltransferase Ste14
VAVLRGLLAPLPMIAVVAGVLLLSAGLGCDVWRWPTAWAFLVAFLVLGCGATGLMAVLRPASFAVRQQGVVARPDQRQPLIDALGLVFYLGCLLGWLAFIPLDVFRFRLLPATGPLGTVLGATMFLAGLAISQLAIAQNRFAAPTIHDQAGQQLIETGLYGLVRHPFYAGMLLVYAGAALFLGSWAAALATSAFLVMTLMRIGIEEAHLRRALPGYGAYVRRVRGRLVPGLL